MFLSLLLATTSSLVVLLSYKVRSLQKERDQLQSKNTEDAKVLFLNSRYASMGETIGNIAHQWKQPLNAIAAIQNGVKASLIFKGDISKEKLLNSVETSFKLLQHLAETIDTFYSFLAQKGDSKKSFVLAEELEKVRKITEYSFENSHIILNFVLDANPTIQGNANEFTHAILNLILNSKDAFDDSPVTMPIITVHVSGREEYCSIVVCDNAGGIRLEPVEMVFDIHITTKESGSGLGLFMTKKIIEQRFGGTISVENRNDGACFTIALPYAEYGEHFTDTATVNEKLSLDRINQLSRKVIELEEVEKSLKKWADIFRQAHWAIAIHVGTSNNFESTNEAFNTLYGYTPQELREITVPDLFPPESLSILPEVQQRAFEKGYAAFETINKRRDGTTFPVSVELIVAKDDEGDILYHMANIWDMSEKKAAEERLLLKKFALDHIQDAVFMIDENANFHYVNQGACAALGYSREEFESMNVGDVDPDWPAERWKEHWEALKKARSITMELRHRRRDGTIFPVEVSANYIEFGDKYYNMAIARDITERKAAQKELLLVDKALNNTMEAAYIFINEHVVQVNDGACKMLGYTREELLSMTLFDFDKALTKEELALLKDNHEPNSSFRFERQHTTKEGRILNVEIDASQFEYDGVSYSFTTVRDITEQKKAHEELLLKEFALNTINEAVYLIDENSMFHYVNEGACAALGYTKEELLTMGVIHIDPNATREWWSDHWAALKEEKNFLVETNHRRKDGTLFPIEVSINYFEYNGVGYNLAVVRDISERLLLEKEKENRAFRSIAENIPDNIARWDTEGRYLYINPTHERTLGVTAATIIGKTTKEAFPDEQFTVGEHSVAQVLATGKALFVQHPIIQEDGYMGWHDVNYVPERDETGKIISVLGVGRDMTYIYRLQNEIEKHRSSLAEAQKLAKIGSWNFDLKTNHLSWSDEYFKILEIDPTNDPDAIASFETFFESVHPEDREFVTERFNEWQTSMESYSTEHRLLMPDGRIKFIHQLGGMRFDQNGTPLYAMGTIHDITERKLAEETLKKALEFNEGIIAAIPDLLFEIAQDGTYVGVWAQDENLLAVQKEMILGKNFKEILPPDVVITSLQAMNEVDAKGFSLGKTYSLDLPEGKRWFELSMTKKKMSGSYISLARDITERKELEEQLLEQNQFLDSLLNAIPVPVFYKDKDTRYRGFNKAFEEFYGKKKDELIGKGVYDLFPPEQAQIFFDADADLFRHGGTQIYETKLQDIRGVNHEVMFHKAIYFDKAGSVIGLIGTILDITERKKMEDLLEKEHKFLIDAQRVAHTGSWYLDIPKGILSWSDETYRIFEFDKENIDDLHKTFYECVHPDDREMVQAPYAETLKAKQSYQVEHRIVMRDGRIKYVIESCEHGYDDEDTPLYSIGTVQDITERKLIEEKLENSYRFLDQMIDSLHDPIFVKDREHRWVLLNEAFCTLIDRPRFMMLGKSDYDFFPKEEADIFWEKDELVFQSGETNVNEEPFTSSDGTIHHIQTIKSTFVTSEGEHYLVGIIRDITERKEAEQKLLDSHAFLTKLIDSLPDPIFVKDRDHTWLILNQANCDLVGLPREELLGKSDYDFFPKEEADVFRHNDEIVFNTGRTNLNEEYFTSSDGTTHYIQTLKSMFTAHDGREYLVGTIRDLSERKNMEDALQSNRNLLHAILESSPEVITFALDKNYRYIAFDSKHVHVMRTIFGKEIAIGMNMLEAITDDVNRGVAKRSFDRALGGESFTAEEEYKDERLSSKYWQIFYSPIRSENGEIIGLTCFNMDITQRREKEETIKELNETLEKRVIERTAQLQESAATLHTEIMERVEAEKRLKLLEMAINNAEDAVFIVDNYSSIVYVNDAACALLSYERDELLSMKIYEIDIHLSKERLNDIENVTNMDKTIIFNTKHKTKDARIIDVQVMLTFFDHDGVSFGVSFVKEISPA